MSSTPLLDRHDADAILPSTRDLLVLWQHPVTSEIIAIGRLTRHHGTYSFAYTRAAAEIDGFRPLPGLEHLDRRYETSQIPTVFGLRVMSPQRPDYEQYLHSIGLEPEHATPWEQIVHSGGYRAGDTLQFMSVPVVTDGQAHARFLVNGVRHVPGATLTPGGRTVRITEQEHEQALRNVTAGDTAVAEPEQDNRHDPHAVLVTHEGVPLGWVPRVLAPGVRELLTGRPLGLRVRRVGEPGSPPHLRLDLELDIAAPDGFSFDPAGRWEPLVAASPHRGHVSDQGARIRSE